MVRANEEFKYLPDSSSATPSPQEPTRILPAVKFTIDGSNGIHHMEMTFDQLDADPVDAVIKASKAILDLKDNWDDEGSQGYEFNTWQRAIDFLRTQLDFAQSHIAHIPPPRITPADEGSIDLLWSSEDFQLLINIPAEPGEPITYSGLSNSDANISGAVDVDQTDVTAIAWLISRIGSA